MKDLDELKRLLADAKYNPDAMDALRRALPDLIAEIGRLESEITAYGDHFEIRIKTERELRKRIERLEAALREIDKLADEDCIVHPDFCQCVEPIQRKLEEICSAALEPEK